MAFRVKAIGKHGMAFRMATLLQSTCVFGHTCCESTQLATFHLFIKHESLQCILAKFNQAKW